MSGVIFGVTGGECLRMVSMSLPELGVFGPQMRCGAPIPRERCPFDHDPHNRCPYAGPFVSEPPL